MHITADPVVTIPDNFYTMIYLIVIAVLGPAGWTLFKAIGDWRKDRAVGRKDRIAEMEDWTHDITAERNFYASRDRWRGEYIGKLEYMVITHPHAGPELVKEVRATMPPEPVWIEATQQPPPMGH